MSRACRFAPQRRFLAPRLRPVAPAGRYPCPCGCGWSIVSAERDRQLARLRAAATKKEVGPER